MEIVSTQSIADVYEGQSVSFEATFSTTAIDAFAALTGDVSPLHVDGEFARQRGFQGRVVHGVLLGGLVSRLVGVHMPGRDCLLHSLTIKFISPVYADEKIRVVGTVEQVSIAAKAIIVRFSIEYSNSQRVAATGKATVGFTEKKLNEQH